MNVGTRSHAIEVSARNAINTLRPVFANLAAGDYRLAPSFTPPATVAIPAFSWAAAPSLPAEPAGRTDMGVAFDFSGVARVGAQPPGAFAPPSDGPAVFEIPDGQTVVLA